MKVFISWSGDLSQELAEVFRNWLPAVLQAVRPYFTPSDVEKGSRWSGEIAKELEESSIGIICVTRENIDSPWVNFEAGALSRKFDESHVCPILFGVDTTDLQGPLVQFQTTPFSKSEIKKLVKTINDSSGENKLSDSVLDNVFDKWWPDLEKDVQEIIENHESVEGKTIRDDRDILEEMLTLIRSLSSRPSQRMPINPKPIYDFMSIIEKTHDLVASRSKFEKIMFSLKLLRDPLNQLVSDLEIPITLENTRKFQSLDYEVFPLKFEDDEIPF